jgi:hypothetical protein
MCPAWFKYADCLISSQSKLDTYRFDPALGNSCEPGSEGDFNDYRYDSRYNWNRDQKGTNNGFFSKPRIKIGKLKGHGLENNDS